MATKTISLDIEAYNRLKRAKRGGESFSETIKRVVPVPPDLDAIVRMAERTPLSDRVATAAEEIVATRRARSRRRAM